MKNLARHRFLSALVFLAPPVSSCFAATPPSPPSQTIITDEQLVALRMKMKKENPVVADQPVAIEIAPKPSPPQDLLSRSDIIFFNGMAMLAPKGAIIHFPEKLKDRLIEKPGCLLYSWKEFYAANRGWITTVEVSRAQAEGKTPLTEETVKKMGTSANLMIATYQGGLISVLPLKVPVPAVATAAKTTP